MLSTKDKIINEAQLLFLKKGYEKTSIQNIIDTVGIAKGTFYYYFKSKDELVEEITSTVAKNAADRIFNELKKSNVDALTKLNNFFKLHSKWKSSNYEILYAALKSMYCDENILYLKKSKEKNYKYFLPIMNLIIEQGTEEGIFNTPYPKNIGEMIMRISSDLSDELANVIIHHKEYDNLLYYLVEKTKLFIHCLERLLGLKDNQIDMIDTNMLKSFVDYLNERNG